VGLPLRPSATWVVDATPSAVPELRRRAAELVSVASGSEEVRQAVALAVSETVTNAVVHAYDGRTPGQVSVSCHADGERFVVEVVDEGTGIWLRQDSPGIGHGLAMVGAMAQALSIAPGPDGRGTAITMAFGRVPAVGESPGLEMLCAIALETVADVSNVDLVQEGVLRRVAAQVAGDAALTAWLRSATPPAKPGTATWAALREGGARLVVHDPTVPRSPGGTGQHLNLMWWVAVALERSDGTPAAIWGLGGRTGGRPAPCEEVISILTDATHHDLEQLAERAVLRGRLTSRVREWELTPRTPARPEAPRGTDGDTAMNQPRR
jgi:serine/threonine-protein kinase RsbW